MTLSSSETTLHKTPAKLRAVLYCRLSDAKENSNSLTFQEVDGRRKADQLGAEVVAVLKDDGISGGIRRAKADQALDMLRTGEADILIVWKFDRWSRQGIIALGDLMAVLQDTAPRTRFITCEGGLDSASEVFPIMVALFAEQGRIERANIKDRVSRSMEELATQGRYAGGINLFGYTPIENPAGDGYVLGLCPKQHPVLRDAISRVIHGETVGSIVRDFNDRKLPSPEGIGWHPNSLRGVLRNPTLRGMMIRNGEPMLGKDGRPIRPNHAALSDEEWYAVQAALDSRSWKVAHNRDGHLLKGLAKCAACGKNLSKRNDRLACSQHRRDFECPGCVISMKGTEEFVSAQFLARYGHEKMMREVEIVEDMSELRELNESLDIVTRLMRDADDNELDELLVKRRDLRKQIADRETRAGAITIIREETGQTYAEAWATADVNLRREMLASHILSVDIVKGLVLRTDKGKRMFSSDRINIRWAEEEILANAA